MIETIVSDRYRVVRQLGEGGMSRVYEIEHLKLKRSFALKVLLGHLTTHEEALVRFEREAELLASLRHPGVVDIVDYGTLDDGAPYMILEFLHGAHLRIRLDRGGALSWAEIARIGDQTMSALALVHRTGITHRDLKPDNIFISIDDAGDERVKLLDFGVSKLRGLGRTTGQHAMLGTPSYMSPEQTQGDSEQIGPWTDVWAMGAILYEMATARVAYTGETLVHTVTNITTSRPPPITSVRQDASEAFVDAIDRAMSLDPERRIQTIDELRQLLRTALEPKHHRLATPIGGVPILTKPSAARITLNEPSGASSLNQFSGSTITGTSLNPAPSGRRMWPWIAGSITIVAILGVIAAMLLG